MISEIPTLKVIREKFEKFEMISISGTISLNSWNEFQSRQGDYNSIDKNEKSNGFAKLAVGGDMVIKNPEISIEHVNAYKYLIQNQENIKKNMLTELFNEYKSLKEEYGYNDEEALEYMPEIKDYNDFRHLIGLSTVHILNVFKENVAYVGYEFGCNWDEEHGLGILTHKDKIIKIGGIDTSFLTWIAEKDLNAEKVNPVLKENHKINEGKNPWWKFWK